MCEGSAPSGSTHLPLARTPASSSRCLRRTPVYWTLWIMPCVNWQPLSCAPRHSMPEFAAHSRKATRFSRGKRFRSCMVNTSGVSTSPLIMMR